MMGKHFPSLGSKYLMFQGWDWDKDLRRCLGPEEVSDLTLLRQQAK